MKLIKENWDKADKITYCIFKHGVLIYVGKKEGCTVCNDEGYDFFPAADIKMPDAGDDVIDMVRIGSGFSLCHRSGGMSNPTELQTRIFNFGKQFTAVEESKMPEEVLGSPKH